MQSARLLGDVIAAFNRNCAVGIRPNLERIKKNLDQSLMLVTALNPIIGYEKAAQIVKTAYSEGITLKAAAIKLNLFDKATFENAVNPAKMLGPSRSTVGTDKEE